MPWDQDEDQRIERTPEQIRQATLNGEIGQWFEDGDPKHGRYSEYSRALEAISLAALKYAEAIKAPASGVENSFTSLLDQGVDVVRNLRWATESGEQTDEEKKALKLWSHRTQPLYDVKRNKTPQLNRPEIEAAVGEYLALPYRSEYIDKLLADILIALEFYQFTDEMVNEEVIPELGPPRSPLRTPHPLLKYSIEVAVLGASWACFVGIVYALHWLHLLGDGWAWGGYLVCTALFLLRLAVVTLAVPFAWRRHSVNASKVRTLMSEMHHCYAELASDGPISARHLLEQLKAAADKGVLWPAPLYALLDDVMTRTGRL